MKCAACCALAVCTLTLTGCASKRVEPQWVYFPPPPATPHVVHLASFNSLNDLVPPRVTWIDLFRGGSASPYVEKPAGVDYQDGHLYICDTGLNVVHDWDFTTGESRRIGHRGEAILQKPVDVAVNAEGMIFVADTQRQEVVVFNGDGGLVGKLRPADRDEFRPTAVVSVASKSGADDLVAADAAAHDLVLFAGEDSGFFNEGGVWLFETAPNNLRPYYPAGLAVVNDLVDQRRSAMFVSDMFNSRVIRMADGKEEMRTFGQPGDRYGDLGHPKHLDVGPDGVIFVADAAFRCVHLFNQEGQLLMLLGGPEDKPGGTLMPLGVAVAESLPENLHLLIPCDFDAHYFVFVTNTIGAKRLSLYAVGLPRV